MTYSVAEYARLKKKSRKTIYQWIKIGRVQSELCCGKLMIYEVGDERGVSGVHESLKGDTSPLKGK